MEIWQFSDPDALGSLLHILEHQAPPLAKRARRLLALSPGEQRQDLVMLAGGLLAESAAVRRAVQVLVFSPPIEEELSHYRLLLRAFPHWLPPGWHNYEAVRRPVLDLAAASVAAARTGAVATLLEIALKERSQQWKKEMASQASLWGPAQRQEIFSILGRRLSSRLPVGLLRRLLQAADLSTGEIFQALADAGRYPLPGVLRRRRRDQQLAAAGRKAPLSPQPRPGQGAPGLLCWGRRCREELSFVDDLIAFEACEPEKAFQLAREVSLRTKRVVLTLHNAALGAASGWGMPSLPQQVPEDGAPALAGEVLSRRRHLDRYLPRTSLCRLFSLWTHRLVRPRLLRELWDLRASLRLNDLPLGEWESRVGAAGELLEELERRLLLQGEDYSISFCSPEEAGKRVDRTLSWYREKKRAHESFFTLLLSLVQTGSAWLSSGRLSYLVVPVIDKFFISSRRDQDLDYLPLFVDTLCDPGAQPLFLFFDDTSRAEHPSLQLAMDRWRRRQPFMGLGVFSSEGVPGESLLDTILARASRVCLFALRPSRVHNPVPFAGLLAGKPRSFLTSEGYDSAWKDNLPFLYSGTLVEPLAGPAGEGEEFSRGVITSAGPLPFGIYHRCRLRRLALERVGFFGEEPPGGSRPGSLLERIWQEYARSANLV